MKALREQEEDRLDVDLAGVGNLQLVGRGTSVKPSAHQQVALAGCNTVKVAAKRADIGTTGQG